VCPWQDVRLYYKRKKATHLCSELAGGRQCRQVAKIKKICREENECVMKKQKINRTKIIMVRLTTAEYEQLNKKYKSTICRKLSDYLRNILLEGKVTVLSRNQSLDDFMAEMIALRKELNGIGNNFNQAVHKLHLLDRIPEFRTWIIQSEEEKKMLLKMIEEIKNRINQFAEKW